MTSELSVTSRPGHAVLTLNRPERRNALSVGLRDEVSDALDELADDESVKAVVVTGAGAVFSSGFDLREFDRAALDERFGRALWASSDRFHRTVLCFPLPLVAAVNGPAVAGGFDLAVMCDLRVASTTARF
ncbi:MAG TPA: enoyl-CoA hydratase/isomerase family protein, partial [Acidimicrobiales bacterium]|nr:enoyl-CoA hydratase/isomerase family protein [Acidimicrobiales bacterium]